MSIIGGLDVHRRQITYDWIDIETGQQRQGRLAPASREHLRGWLEQFAGQQAAFALEGCTGWRYVVEELQQAGITAHLAEPADTRALRGRKRHAKTDRADARHLRELLIGGRLPESWIPPTHVLEARTQVRLYKALVDQRTAWQQRIHAVLFHHGVPAESDLLVDQRRQRLTRGTGLTPTAHQAVLVALRMVDAIDAELDRLRAELAHLARHQPGCRALCGLYGVGPITAVAIWAELGDARRFSSSRHAVRHTGLDVTVYASDDKRAPGHLARQGPAVLRWALFEAAQCAARASSPDHAYYTQVKARLGGNRAALRWPASSPAAATTCSARSAMTRWRRWQAATNQPRRWPDGAGCARPAHHTDVRRPAPAGPLPPRPRAGRPQKIERPPTPRQRGHPIEHHVAGPAARAPR